MKWTVSSARLPNLVILTRVALAFSALGLFSLPFPYPAVGLGLIPVAIAMDGLDGYLARRLGVTSELGAILDITGDRIVEHVFWIYFTVAGLVPLWVTLLIVSRSFTVDAVRSVALGAGKTAFGERTLQRSTLSRFLVASRAMRNAYGVAKVAAFTLLGLLVLLKGVYGTASHVDLRTVTDCVVLLTLGICIVRALPVVWDARALFRAPESDAR